jgi:hypothetical protein
MVLYYCDLLLGLFHHQQRLAQSTGPNRVGSPDDEGSAIPRNVVVEKHKNDG